MRGFFDLVFVAGLFTASMFGPVGAEQRTPPTILDFISQWLQTEYRLEGTRRHPNIVALPPKELVARRYGAGAKVDAAEIVALYDADAGAILVSDEWMGNTVAEISVLVHEMVHHLQATAGTVFACPAERKKLAYRAQADWLEMFGLDLKGSFGIDPALVVVATVCTH